MNDIPPIQPQQNYASAINQNTVATPQKSIFPVVVLTSVITAVIAGTLGYYVATLKSATPSDATMIVKTTPSPAANTAVIDDGPERTDLSYSFKGYSQFDDIFYPFTIKYPNTWRMTEEKNEEYVALTVTFTLPNNDYFQIVQAEVGYAECAFGEETAEGMASKYESFTPFTNKDSGEEWRLVALPKGSESMPTHTICSKKDLDKGIQSYSSATKAGLIKIHANNPTSLTEITEVLKTLTID
jgi:hypothetical protein